MAEAKERALETPNETDSDSSSDGDSLKQDDGLTYARRGEQVVDITAIEDVDGFDAERMRDRSLLTEAEEKALMRKVDWRMMTVCSLIYLLKNIDADNIANARVLNNESPSNIMTQLRMTSDQYNLLNVLYYVPYIVFEAPSNLVLKRFNPSAWQSRIMISWGAVLLGHVGITNKEGLYTARFLLGLFEAGMFPGVILQMTYWYRPDEMSLRMLFLYIMGNLSGVFSSLISLGFENISGAYHFSGWQWLFFSEGLFTIVVHPPGLQVKPSPKPDTRREWLTPTTVPPTAEWLTEAEKAFIQARLPANAPRAAEKDFKFGEIVDNLKDCRLWLFTLIWATFTVGTAGVRFYQPTVISNLGFNQDQLLDLPISLLSVVAIGITGLLANTGRLPRPVYPLGILSILLVCYGVVAAYPSHGAVYAATLIGNAFATAFFPLMWPWRVQTTSRATGSAFSIGFVNSYGQVGGAIGPLTFREMYQPHYKESFASAMALVVACMLVTSVTWWVTRRSEADTRRLMTARVRAGREGLVVLNDVVDRDLQNGDLQKKRASCRTGRL
ncbi:transporter [Tolypocladium capitatum]|uniref:Transporter n=1 Tax=Tolypocladium capitatum TaxID=45235 RepID=A0A2K3Q0Y8_9HYPO|nr:transporter [Tolypocladium capitatum]